ncbi:MAG: choice-of-anchor tandem repeat GloVer-containing protein, partial [Candidatus Korobacteraceae bacterium]
MTTPFRHSRLNFGRNLQRSAFALGLVFALTTVSPLPARAQTYTVLHSFNLISTDGARPYAGLTADRAGNLYGTTAAGGPHHAGEVFKMMKLGQSWILNPIYEFTDGSDGAEPQEEVTFAPDGALYGNNSAGGQFGGGTIFKVQPPARAVGFALGGWTETSLYQFAFEQNLYGSPLTFDSAGNMYGSTAHWSGNDKGAVYQLIRNGHGWNLNVIYQFSG